MNEAEICVGSVVRLAGDSPDLTVIAVDPRRGYVTVAWMAGSKHQRASYPAAALRVVKPFYLD